VSYYARTYTTGRCIIYNTMLYNLLGFVMLAGLTVACLLICLAKWGVLQA
jgi:hypothetical protein